MQKPSSRPRRSGTQGEQKSGVLQFPDGITASEIRAELRRMLASEVFTRSERLSRFLEFIVEKTLAGEGKLLNQYIIALEVFDKPVEFDPNVDPIIRVEAGRLRSKLREFYATAGETDPLRVNLPKIGYCPVFSRQVEPDETEWTAETENLLIQPPLNPVPSPSTTSMAPGAAAIPASYKPPVSIAVLPFAKLSPDDTSRRLCEEIYQRVLQELVLTEGFLVRAGACHLSEEIENIQEIGQKLSTDLFLEGSLQRADQKFRVYAMLARSSDGCGIWADSYNRTIAGIASNEREIARLIVDSVVKAVHPETVSHAV